MSDELPVSVQELKHSYGAREALRGISFEVGRGEIFGVLGPNGGGKTTLFRILSTSLRPCGGSARLLGFDVVRDAPAVRRRIGVVFQSPALDKKLTAAENLWHHGHLYGLWGKVLCRQIDEMLARVGLAERARDRVEQLSGGQRRRVEVAQGLLHRPKLLIMDEPSTGLDPAARRDLWDYLKEVRAESGLTILVTTHLMEEADGCDRLAILDRGELVALDTPQALREAVGGDVIYLETPDPAELTGRLRARFGCPVVALNGTVRMERERAHELVAELFQEFPGSISSVTVRRPSLEDVFIQRTGHRLEEREERLDS